MALPNSYLTSSKNLDAILNAIQGAQAPERFTQAFLEGLGFTSSSDRLIIGVLKALKFIDDGGRPKDRYFRFLDQTQGAKVMAEGIRDGWQDLFKVNIKANEMSKVDLTNKFKTLSQGQLTDPVLDKMSMTFMALVKHADFKSPVTESQQGEGKEESEIESEGKGKQAEQVPLKLGGLVYNIQIVLPESRDSAVYDALFTSLRRHLL